MKILWHSNAPGRMSNTGYGTQTGLVTPLLAAAGHDVVISCMNGINGFPSEWEGITLLPSGLTTYSGDILEEHARRFFGRDPGLVIIHYDAWAIGAEPVRELACAAWSPVHSDPMSQGDKVFYAVSGAQPMAFSRWGERKMREAGLDPLFIPHGVDTKSYRPLSPAERVQARRALRVPEDAYVMAVVGANKGTDPPRKGWGELFWSFAQFRDGNKSMRVEPHPGAVLLVHSLANTPEGWGLDMRPIIAALGIGDSVIFTDDYNQVTGLCTDEYLRKLMGCADVFVNPSWGEGFGIPAVEAQACGVPVIVGDNSAQTELCGSGWLVNCQPYWQPRDQAWWHAPLVASLVKQMVKAYARRGDRALRDAARSFAERYDADLVFTQSWKPALEMLEQYAGAARVRPPRNGATVPLPTNEADGLRWVARGRHTDDWISVAHEDALRPVLFGLMPEGGTLLDVGAHVGRWALRLAAKAGRVICVEANPDTAAVLRYHIALNGITSAEVIEVAAWDMPARLVLEDPYSKVTGGSTRTMEPGDVMAGGVSVDALPLDAVLDDLDRCDLIKLDVEGADLHALWGMRELLARLRPVLFVEDHSIYGYYAHQDLIGLLDKLGYGTETFIAHLPGDRTAPYVIARPEPRDLVEQPGDPALSGTERGSGR